MRVGGRNVVGADLGALIGVAHVDKGGVGAGAATDSRAAVFHVLNVQVVEGVGVLEPGAAVVEVEMHGVGLRKAVIDTVEEILLVALVVEDGELRRIEKASGVQGVGFDEVAPALSAVGEIEASICRPEGPIGSVDISGRLGDALSGARGGYDDEAGLVAVFGRWRAADDLDGLNGVGWELIGKDLALLVGNGLAVNGEGVGGVVAESMKEAVGVGRNAGRGQRDQRTERGGCTLQRHFVEQVAINVDVKGGVVLNEVATGLDRYRLASTGDLKNELHADSQRRANLDALAQMGEAFGGDVNSVRVEGDVGEGELARSIGGCVAIESADLIGEMNGGVGDDGAGGIGDRATHGSGVATLRRRGERRKEHGDEGKDAWHCATNEWHGLSPEQWLNAVKAGRGTYSRGGFSALTEHRTASISFSECAKASPG